MGSNKSEVIIALTFVVGFFLGYKAKEWRITWLKRKRDRLADKLRHAQAKLDTIAKNF